ncbi:MAG: 4Fe-4S dicluster domain-containing protein [bacterium]
MNKKQLEFFFKYLKRDNLLAGPRREGCVLNFTEIDNINDIELTNEIPLYSFKKFLLPQREILATSPNPSLSRRGTKGMALVGLTVPDLKAITILNQVFEKDPFYQDRMSRTLVVGYGEFPCEYNWIFAFRYEENVLEHIQFDVFIIKETSPNLSLSNSQTTTNPSLARMGTRLKGGIYKVFTGSEDGKKILDEFGYQRYENVQYSGYIREEGVEEKVKDLKKAMESLSSQDKIFQDLGKKCIECGRCSIICPLCYCFCLTDGGNFNKQRHTSSACPDRLVPLKGRAKERMATTCFYSEFSEIAVGHKFLKNPAERIYNWYEHKFLRFPEEFSVAGCVNCGRCAKVCPAGINIREVINRIKN